MVFIFCVIRRKPTSRRLWDKTSDRWEHDMYREEEQGPKTKEELEVTKQESKFSFIQCFKILRQSFNGYAIIKSI